MERTQNTTVKDSEALLDNRSLRDKYADQVEALERVGKLAMLPDGLHVTVEMVANFYKAPIKTIYTIVLRHKDELMMDGIKTVKGEDFEFFKMKNTKYVHPKARSIIILPRRAVLRIGMLLRDSEVAKTLRSYLLNVEEIARNKFSEIINEATKWTSKELPQTLAEAMRREAELWQMHTKALLVFADTADENQKLKTEVKTVKTEVENVKAENAVMAPKARRFDRFLNADNLMRVEDLAKAFGIIGMGRNKMFKYLRDKGLLVKSQFGSRTLPFQRYLNVGLFEVVWKNYEKFDSVTGQLLSLEYPMTYVTAKGVDYIYKLMVQDGLILA